MIEAWIAVKRNKKNDCPVDWQQQIISLGVSKIGGNNLKIKVLLSIELIEIIKQNFQYLNIEKIIKHDI
jgi:hypothetical protein